MDGVVRCSIRKEDRRMMESTSNDRSSANVAEQWKTYKSKLFFYLNNKNMNDREKIRILMSWVGEDGHDIHETVGICENPTFEAVVQKFDECFASNPAINSVLERSVFFRLTQQPDQSIQDFIIRLKRQAALCQFSKDEFDNLIRDILLIGIRNVELREILLRYRSLTLKKAEEVCMEWERSHSKVPDCLAINASARRRTRSGIQSFCTSSAPDLPSVQVRQSVWKKNWRVVKKDTDGNSDNRRLLRRRNTLSKPVRFCDL